MKMIDEVTITCVDLPEAGTDLLVAVSGGIDSIVLLDVLVADGRWPITVFHLNHNLREEAAADAAFVKHCTEAYDVPLIVENKHVQSLAEKWSCGVEEAGRRCRYDALAEHAERLQIPIIVTAHHQDDQVETVLSHIFRGAGATGLGGMRSNRVFNQNCTIWRPFLQTKRLDIEAHAQRQQLQWQEDSSNTDTRFQRNFFRHCVIPQFETAAPGFCDALTEFADNKQQSVDLLREQTTDWLRDHHQETCFVIDETFRQADDKWQEHVCYQFLTAMAAPMSRRIVRIFLDLCLGDNGRQCVLGAYTFQNTQKGIKWASEQSSLFCLTTDHHIENIGSEKHSYHDGDMCLQIQLIHKPQNKQVTNNLEAYLDRQACVGYLQWRMIDLAERWHPLGAGGSKRALDYLKDKKVSAMYRRQWPVLADEAGIVWIPGWTIAHRVRITDATDMVLWCQHSKLAE